MYRYLFFINNFPIRSYGLILAISISLSIGVAYFLAKKEKNNFKKHIVDLSLYCSIIGLIGARVWDVFFFDWGYYSNHFNECFYIWQGGLSIQGGIFFGVLTAIIYSKVKKINVLQLADTLAPAIILGQSMGRCANFMNGDAFGIPTEKFFGIIYPENTLAFSKYGYQPLWPVEIWESQLDIFIFALLLIFKNTKNIRGQTFFLYLLCYSFERFFLEYLRGDYNPILFNLKSAQIIALITFIFSGISFFILNFYKRS